MREIKFRAWFKDASLPLKGMVYESDKLILLLRVMDGVVYWLGIGGLFNADIPVYMDTENKVFVMQYTGLKDKNGKEIYEGDIVNDSVHSVSEVKFLNASFVIKPKTSQHWVIGQRRAGNMEIIGNIYENPELLALTLT